MSTQKRAKNYLHYLHKKRNYRKDILGAEKLEELAAIEADLLAIKENRKNAPGDGGDSPDLEGKLDALENRMKVLIPPDRSEGWVENVEVVLTAVVLALALKAFFLAPFKIPTGSMQPTLYGITCESLEDVGGKPNPVQQLTDSLLFGYSYHHVEVRRSGTIREIRPGSFLGLFQWITVDVAGEDYRLMCSLDTFRNGLSEMLDRQIRNNKDLSNIQFKKGDHLANFRSKTGDRLLVNRMAYHFFRPEVGQIFVFNTEGIRGIEAENRLFRQIDHTQFYIKRCVGGPGDRLSIDPPYLLNHEEIVKPEKYADDFTRIYSMDHGYGGYELFSDGQRARLDDLTDSILLRDDEYFAMGDNSANSSDSRKWGTLQRRNLVGTGLIVYWPLSVRWGLIQ